MNKLSLILTSLLAVTSTGSILAAPKHNPVPGGIYILPLAPEHSPEPQVTFAGKPVTTMREKGEWKAVVGIPLDTLTGIQTLHVKNPVTKQVIQRTFDINAKHYRTQRLKIKDKKRVNPSGSHLKRILREKDLKDNLKKTFSRQKPDLNFIRPVKGRDTGRFGLKRFINNQPRNPHSGMDIAAPQGTPIKNAAGGKVIYTGNLFFSGNVVYVDHGEGVISMYAHLKKIQVKQGQQLQQGDIVGLVGRTGRATGPHLHWSVYLNGTAVDPSLFI
jgi:murein DD-endopeptidase MepM/ murein hydrolase activator NlpD